MWKKVEVFFWTPFIYFICHWTTISLFSNRDYNTVWIVIILHYILGKPMWLLKLVDYHLPSRESLFLCMEKHHDLVRWKINFKISGPISWTRAIVLGCVEASRTNCKSSLEDDLRIYSTIQNIWGCWVLNQS